MASLSSILPSNLTYADDFRFDTPLKLYDNPDGIFYSLCERSGIKREDIVNAAEHIND